MPTINYDQFLDQLHQSGYNTTKTYGNEANFLDYGNALGSNVKQMITDSFDCDADYELQAQIASAFGSRSVMQSGDFVNTLRNMGLNVQVSYQSTQYMVDEKAAGHGSRQVRNGGISIYTISDGKGGEIVIADANGNAALEIEEVFMNQILNDIAVDVEQLQQNHVAGASAASSSSSSSPAASVLASEPALQVNQTNEPEEEVKQEDYNSTVEEYLRAGYTRTQAQRKADDELGVTSFVYTGTFDYELEKEEEKAA